MGISTAERRYRRALAQNLTRLREDRAVTQADLAGSAFLHERHIQKIEAGQVNVSLRTLSRLAEGLSVDVQRLLERDGARPRGL